MDISPTAPVGTASDSKLTRRVTSPSVVWQALFLFEESKIVEF